MTDRAPNPPSLDDVKQPGDCADMGDVRAGVDALDSSLVALLALRFAYMRAAARIKDDKGAVRDEPRKAQVMDNVKAAAAAMGVPTDIAADIWERLIEGSIAYEMDEWERLRD